MYYRIKPSRNGLGKTRRPKEDIASLGTTVMNVSDTDIGGWNKENIGTTRLAWQGTATRQLSEDKGQFVCVSRSPEFLEPTTPMRRLVAPSRIAVARCSVQEASGEMFSGAYGGIRVGANIGWATTTSSYTSGSCYADVMLHFVTSLCCDWLYL